MSQLEEDARLGRTMRNLARWWGASLLICCVLTIIFGETGKGPLSPIFWASITGGVLIVCWLNRAEKKREAALQAAKPGVESTATREKSQTGESHESLGN